ncbi:hypothetical protein [Flavobacterium sp. ACAM 123]|jgi:predicted heme/steroid binding protein|uniref:hypothetical protein n=1 Tax=Flavobacterium sp. ACAM 123 TaxID=1189620 RepID=UPI00031089E4|nr:hypothetical protein [Flavobacterium sp. ACAM 123]
MRNLTLEETININGGHKGKAYQAGKAVANAIESAYNHVADFCTGLWDEITS